MGEIRLQIPDTVHKALKKRAAIESIRLPVLITKILRAHVVSHHNAKIEGELNKQ